MMSLHHNATFLDYNIDDLFKLSKVLSKQDTMVSQLSGRHGVSFKVDSWNNKKRLFSFSAGSIFMDMNYIYAEIHPSTIYYKRYYVILKIKPHQPTMLTRKRVGDTKFEYLFQIIWLAVVEG